MEGGRKEGACYTRSFLARNARSHDFLIRLNPKYFFIFGFISPASYSPRIAILRSVYNAEPLPSEPKYFNDASSTMTPKPRQCARCLLLCIAISYDRVFNFPTDLLATYRRQAIYTLEKVCHPGPMCSHTDRAQKRSHALVYTLLFRVYLSVCCVKTTSAMTTNVTTLVAMPL